MNNNKLQVILREAIAIQSALLRFRHEEAQQNLHVKIAPGDGDSLCCVITGKMPAGIQIRGRDVHLIQKNHDDYFFISGHISEEVQGTPGVLSVCISKASWFVRKRKGSVTWLREKHTYETEPEINLVQVEQSI